MIDKIYRNLRCFESIPSLILGVFLIDGLKFINGISNLHSAIDNAAEKLELRTGRHKLINGEGLWFEDNREGLILQDIV